MLQKHRFRCLMIGTVFGLLKESVIMFPMWFFILLLILICYLLIITRPSEESIFATSRHQLRRIQFWIRSRR